MVVAVMTWADMSEAERVEAIQRGLLAGNSYSAIAAGLGTTKAAVASYFWRRGLAAPRPAEAARGRPTGPNSIILFMELTREHQGLSARAFSAAAGYSPAYWWNLLARRQTLPMKTAEDFLNVLGYTLTISPLGGRDVV